MMTFVKGENEMKKKISVLTTLVFFLALFCLFANSNNQSLEGTWIGKTEIPDVPEEVGVTLVLEMIEGKYKGLISDSTGMLQDVEIEDVQFEDNELSFRFEFFDGEGSNLIQIVLEVKGDAMSGYWEHQEGNSAPIEMERKK
jgi:hypothetical protein